MNKNLKHIIHRVNVDINTNSVRVAERINKNVNHYVNEMILPVIEEIINKKYANFDLRLEHLDLNVDFASEKQISAFEIRNALELALENTIQKHNLSEKLTSEEVKSSHKTDVSNAWSVLIHFLKTGKLPWFVNQNDSLERWIETCGPQLREGSVQNRDVDAFVQLLASNKTAAIRLLKQLPNSFIVLFIETYYSPMLSKSWGNFRNQIQTIQNDSIVLNFSLLALQTIANSYSGNKMSSQEVSKALALLIQEWQNMNASTSSKNFDDESLEKFIDIFNVILQPLNVSLDKIMVNEWLVKSMPNTSSQTPNQVGNIRIEQDSTAPNIVETDLHPDIFNFAGLIILHPYLKMFFKNIGVMKENENNVAPEHFDLATHSLFFLATGQTNAYESDMQFVKWLLNIPEGVVIDRNYKLGQNVVDEAENLLASVVENWTALKNSSNDTLRAMFFQRSASLKEDANCYQLHFERKAQDVLLNQLPWGISFVKLPWKQKLIQVIW